MARAGGEPGVEFGIVCRPVDRRQVVLLIAYKERVLHQTIKVRGCMGKNASLKTLR